jgi:thioredoxin 1
MNDDTHRAPDKEVEEANFEAEVLRSTQPVLVVFWAPWSRPCHVLDSVLDDVAAQCAGSVRVIKVNADNNPDLSLWYDVQAIPALLYFVNGMLRAKIVGTATKEAILAKMQRASDNNVATL